MLTMGDCAVAAWRFSASRASAGLSGSPCSGRSSGERLALAVILTCWWILSRVASLLDHVGLSQDLEELLGGMAAKRASMSAFGIASRLTGTPESGPVRP